MNCRHYWSVLLLAGGLAVSCFSDNFKTEINVRDFGAVGDGKNDDTAAIQNAMDAASKASTGKRWEEKGTLYISGPELVFPSGKYKITDTLYPSSRIIRSRGEACIEQHNPEKDIFYFRNIWQCKIEGLVFLGGKTQLSLGNTNTDKGQIIIENCKFYHSKGPAVLTRKGSNSTFLNLRECVIVKCLQALVSNCDWTTVRDCWITSSEEMENMAVIENRHGNMTIDNMLGVPQCKGIGQRWVDNMGSLFCTGCRFGGEGGGFTPIYNFAKYRATGGNFVVIENSTLCSQSNYKGICAVYCEEIPNCIEIRNSILLGIPPVRISKKIDQKNYFKASSAEILKFSVHSPGEFNQLPEILKNPPLSLEKIEGQLSIDKTQEFLKNATAALNKTIEKTENDGCFRPSKENWSLDEYMDGTSRKNSEYLSLAFAGEKTVIMRRVEAKENWPHVEIKNINVDLDKYPVLCIQFSPEKCKGPFMTALKLVDNDNELLHALSAKTTSQARQIYDLKKIGLSGTRNISIRIYYIGREYVPATEKEPFTWKRAIPGDYVVIDSVRFLRGDCK